MRYIETNNGVLLAPRRFFSHQEMLYLAGRRRDEVISAGFLSGRYAAEEKWAPYGESVGLKVKSNPNLQVPAELWVGLAGPLSNLFFSSCQADLSRLRDVVKAVWGMSEEGWEGTCAVFSPLHPKVKLSADSILRD